MLNPANSEDVKAKEAADFVRSNIQQIKWRKTLTNILRGRIYGVSIMEKIFIKSDGKIWIDEINRIPDAKIEFNAGQMGVSSYEDRYGELILRKGMGDRVWVSDYRNKLVVSVDKDDVGYYDFSGVMRVVARWYVIKAFAIQSWAQFAEKYGFPIPTITMSKENLEANKSAAIKVLSSIGPNRYALLMEGMELEIKDGAGANNVEVFGRLIELCNTEMAIAINGQNLTSEVKGGSFAASQTHKEILSDITKSDLEFLDEVVNDQIVDQLVRINFPDLPYELYPVYQTVIPETINVEAEARALRELSKLIPIPVRYIQERTGVPAVEENEQTIGGYTPSVLDQI
jgi:phage gp29-like protein